MYYNFPEKQLCRSRHLLATTTARSKRRMDILRYRLLGHSGTVNHGYQLPSVDYTKA